MASIRAIASSSVIPTNLPELMHPDGISGFDVTIAFRSCPPTTVSKSTGRRMSLGSDRHHVAQGYLARRARNDAAPRVALDEHHASLVRTCLERFTQRGSSRWIWLSRLYTPRDV